MRARSGGGCGLGLVVGVGLVAIDLGVVFIGVNFGLIGFGFIGFGLVGCIGLHTQGAVEVLERKVDLAKVHVAGRVVGCGRALGHRGARLVGGHGKGELARDVGRGQALGCLELLGAGEFVIHGLGAVDVLEHGLDVTVVGRCRQGTVTVVDDDNLKVKARRFGRDALVGQRVRELKRRVVDGPRKLGILVGADGAAGAYQIGEHLGRVMQRTEAHLAATVGSRSAIDCFRLARISDAKVELAVGHQATGQLLGGNDLDRLVGRSAIAVFERDQGALDLVLAALVDHRMRALGAASNGRGGSKRTSAVIGDSNRHGALGVVVGVAGLAVVLLGHGIRKGLTGVSLRKLDLMASQDVDQADRSLCRRRGLEFVDSGQQVKRVGRSLVGGLHGKGELTLGHGTSGEALAELKAAGCGVVKLSAIRVGKASVFRLGDVGGQDALAIVGHGHFGGRDVLVVRHASRAALILADLVLVGSGSCVANLAELDGGDAVLRVLLAHGHGCGVGQRSALGSGDGKAELVRIRPLTSVDSLAQVKVEICIERVHAVGVHEGRGLVALQDMLGLERTVAVISDGGHDGVLGVAVGDAVVGVARDLAQRVGVLAGLVVLHGAHLDFTVGIVLAGGDGLGVLALALDELEGELAVLEVAAGQDLGRGDLVGDAELARIRLVGVAELRLVGALQDMLRLERAVTLVGDGGHDGVLGGAVGDAVVGVARDLAQRVGVLAGLVVLHGAHLDFTVGIVLAGGDGLGVLALALDELEGELAVLEVAAGQDLGRGDLVGDAGALGGHAVGVHKPVAGVAIGSRRRQGAIAVVDNGHIRVNCRHGSAHARGQLAGLLGSDVMNGPRGFV